MHKLKSASENKSKIKQLITLSVSYLESYGPNTNSPREKAAPSMSQEIGNSGTHTQVLPPDIAQENSKNGIRQGNGRKMQLKERRERRTRA